MMVIFILGAVIVAQVNGIEPLDHPFAVCWISLFLGFLLVILLSLASVTSRIAEELLYFAAETANEAASTDEDIDNAAKTFDELFSFYGRTLQTRPLAVVVSKLIRIRNQLESARNGVSEGSKTRSVMRIQEVGFSLIVFCESLRRFLGWSLCYVIQIPRLSLSHSDDFDCALKKFVQAVDDFRRQLSYQNANVACLNSRVAGTILHCIWPELQSSFRVSDQTDEALVIFDRYLSEAFSLTRELEKKSSGSEKEGLSKFANSIDRRRNALRALRTQNRKELWEILASHATRVGNLSPTA